MQSILYIVDLVVPTITHSLYVLKMAGLYRSHQLPRTHFNQYQALSDQEMGTAISCTNSSQVGGLIHTTGRSSFKHCIMSHLFVQLFSENCSYDKAIIQSQDVDAHTHACTCIKQLQYSAEVVHNNYYGMQGLPHNTYYMIAYILVLAIQQLHVVYSSLMGKGLLCEVYIKVRQVSTSTVNHRLKADMISQEGN